MSMNRIDYTRSLAFVGALTFVTALAWAQQLDDIFTIDKPVNHDVYAAHSDVDVRTTIDGDLVAAGQRVTVTGEVTGDVIVAAQNIEIRSNVRDDLRAAGQHINVMSPVSGHVVAAGQSVTIQENVGDWAWLAGNTVEVLGNVGSDLKIHANNVTINAEVAGNVELIGDELNIGPNAIVRGNLKWRSNNAANISKNAQIDGEIIEEPLPGLLEELSAGGRYSLPLNLTVAVMVLFLLFSRPLKASVERVMTYPGWTLLLGLAVLLASLPLAIILFITGVGVWLGFAVLLIYLTLLLLGLLTGLFTASDVLLRTIRAKPAVWQSLVAILVTVVAFGLLSMVPMLGFILVVVTWSIGIGALCWNTWKVLRDFGQNPPQSV